MPAAVSATSAVSVNAVPSGDGAKANTCGKCANDAQCQADTRYKNTRNLCKTTAGANNGECLTNTCTNNGQACAANTADFCCASVAFA